MEIKDMIERDYDFYNDSGERVIYRRMTDFERLNLQLKCEELKILGKISKALDVMAFGEKIIKGV